MPDRGHTIGNGMDVVIRTDHSMPFQKIGAGARPNYRTSNMNLDLGLYTYSTKPSTWNYPMRTPQLGPVALVIDPVSNDDWVNAWEKQDGVTINGWAEAGSTVLLEWGDARKEVLVDATGRWQTIFLNHEVPPDGPTRLSAIVINTAGYVSASTTRTVAIDTTEPTEPTLDPVSGDNRITAAEKAAGLTLSGSADPGSEVYLNLVGHTIHWKRVIADTTGKWRATLTSNEIPDGTFVIAPQAFDQAGNPSPWREYRIAVEAFPPTIDQVTEDDTVNLFELSRGVVVSGSASAGDTVYLTWGRITKNVSVGTDGKWSATFTSNEVPPEGKSILNAKAIDKNGNVSAQTSREVTVDTTRATVPTVDPVTSDNRITAAEKAAGITLSGNADPGDEVRLWWQAGNTPHSKNAISDATGKWWATFTSDEIPDGTFSIVLQAVDPTGNPSNWREYRLFVEPTAPIIDSVGGDNWVNSIEKQLGVTVTGRGAVDSLVMLEWGGVRKTVLTDYTGKWSGTFASHEVPADGSTLLHASTITESGNTSTPATQIVTVDTTSPNEPTLDPVTGDNRITATEKEAGITLNGSAEPGTRVVLLHWLVGTTPQSKSVATDTTGKWSTTLSSSEIPNETFHIWLQSIDQAGNQSYLRGHPIALELDAPRIDPVTGDNQISASEKVAGVVVSGNAEPGSIVRVDWDWDFSIPGPEATKTVAVDGEGRWSALFSSSELPENRESATVIYATSIDRAGNIAPHFSSEIVQLDTMVIGA